MAAVTDHDCEHADCGGTMAYHDGGGIWSCVVCDRTAFLTDGDSTPDDTARETKFSRIAGGGVCRCINPDSPVVCDGC